MRYEIEVDARPNGDAGHWDVDVIVKEIAEDQHWSELGRDSVTMSSSEELSDVVAEVIRGIRLL